MVAAFIGMVIPFLQDRPTYCAVLVSGAFAMVFNGLPHKLGLIAASILGIVAGVICESIIDKNTRRATITAGKQ
jgi:predicted branched-subunit amino acid permease